MKNKEENRKTVAELSSHKPVRTLDFSKKEDIEEFFGNEEFPEYEDLFDEDK